jgi:hypothetical protein
MQASATGRRFFCVRYRVAMAILSMGEGAVVAFIAGCGQKKKAVLSAPPNARKEKKPCGLKTKIWKQTIDFSTRKGLEFDTFRLCSMFYAALAKCLWVERYALSGVRFCDLAA